MTQNFDKECKAQNCPHYIERIIGFHPEFSCKFQGDSQHIEKVAEDCPYASKVTKLQIKRLKAELKAAQRAAKKISRIREKGKDRYGEIVPEGEDAFVLYLTNSGELTVLKWQRINPRGLLRFKYYEQAELFLDNNQELCLAYLKILQLN